MQGRKIKPSRHTSILATHLIQEANRYDKPLQLVSFDIDICLNINIRKSQALCINTSPAVTAGLRELGIETPEHIKHLGLYLGKNIRDTVTETMRQIDPKALKRRSKEKVEVKKK